MAREAWIIDAVRTPRGKDPEFLLVGAHLDSWYEGVTDNATGDACLMEMARVLNKHRKRLRRGVRFAWWPGHSHGRYAGSTWYADFAFDDLRRRALGYLNIDSPGVRDTEIFDCRYNMGEVEDLMKETVPEVTGQSPNIRRPFKAGDQSFWGIGLPSLGAFRMLPLDHPDRATVGGCGAGWWWHSPADTLDKADARILAADTGVTKSDIEIWHNHIGAPKDGSHKGRLVVLNKIDGLWDELRNEGEVNREIDRQVRVFIALFEPALLLIMATLVGFIVISMLLPVFSLSSMIK